jgi:hypothetical protein
MARIDFVRRTAIDEPVATNSRAIAPPAAWQGDSPLSMGIDVAISSLEPI